MGTHDGSGKTRGGALFGSRQPLSLADFVRSVRAGARAYRDQIRGFGWNARLLLLSTTLGAFSVGVFAVAYNLYVLALGFDAADAGRLITAGSLAAGLTAIPAGLLAIRAGAKRLILAGALFLGVGAVLQIVPAGFGYLLAGAALGGIGGVLWSVVLSPLLAASADDAARGYLFTVSAVLFLGMSFAGNLLGGWAPGEVSKAIGWPRWAGFLAVLGGASLVGGLGFFPLLALRSVSAELPRSVFRRLRAEWPVAARLLAVHGTIAAGAGITIPFLNIYFTQTLGLSEAAFGLLAGAGVIARLAGTVLGPALATRLGKVPAIVATQTASIPVLLAMGFLPWPIGSSLAFLVRGSVMNMTAPIRGALYMESVSEGSRPAVNAVLLVGWNLIWAAGAAVGGQLAADGAFGTAVTLTAGIYAISNPLLWAFFGRRRGSPTVTAPASTDATGS